MPAMELTAPPRLYRLGFFLVCVLLYMWPALLNGGPFFFPDTSNYIRAADAAVVSVTGHRTQWSDRIVEVSAGGSAAAGGHGSAGSNASDVKKSDKPILMPTRPVLNGRSIYYGALLYASSEGFGRFGPVVLQSILAVVTVALVLLAVPVGSARRRWLWIGGGMLAIGLLTPLPFFVSRLMPGVFAGLLVAALISLLTMWRNHSVGSRVFLIILCSAAVTFHTTHVLLTLVILIGALLLNVGRSQGWGLRFTLPVCLLAIAAVAQMAFSAAVERALNAPPISPPFLSARLIDDGPGYQYLLRHCPKAPFVLCRYLDRMPHDSDTMLWSTDPRNGIFSAVPSVEQRQIADQDKTFYLTVLADEPADVVESAIRSGFEQLGKYDLDHFNYSKAHRVMYRTQIPSDTYSWIYSSAAFSNTVPTMPTIITNLIISFFGVFVISAVLLNAVINRQRPAPVVEFCILVLLTIVANAMICGALSTPHSRYQMRLIWLLPLAVTALAISGYTIRSLFMPGFARKQAA